MQTRVSYTRSRRAKLVGYHGKSVLAIPQKSLVAHGRLYDGELCRLSGDTRTPKAGERQLRFGLTCTINHKRTFHAML